MPFWLIFAIVFATQWDAFKDNITGYVLGIGLCLGFSLLAGVGFFSAGFKYCSFSENGIINGYAFKKEKTVMLYSEIDRIIEKDSHEFYRQTPRALYFYSNYKYIIVFCEWLSKEEKEWLINKILENGKVIYEKKDF